MSQTDRRPEVNKLQDRGLKRKIIEVVNCDLKQLENLRFEPENPKTPSENALSNRDACHSFGGG
jgi:hypothetical protein